MLGLIHSKVAPQSVSIVAQNQVEGDGLGTRCRGSRKASASIPGKQEGRLPNAMVDEESVIGSATTSPISNRNR